MRGQFGAECWGLFKRNFHNLLKINEIENTSMVVKAGSPALYRERFAPHHISIRFGVPKHSM